MNKNIYFVRPGQSTSNTANIRQGAVSPLSLMGEIQTHTVAERFTNIDTDIVLSSPYGRAEDTAEPIASMKNVKMELHDNLRERRHPSKIEGKSGDDPEVKDIMNQIFEQFHDPETRHSDEEKFDEIKARAKEVVEMLENREEENIVVVTHGYFMRVIHAYVIYREELTSKILLNIIYTHIMRNTGITLYSFDGDNNKDVNKGWRVITWNDHTHLGELDRKDKAHKSKGE